MTELHRLTASEVETLLYKHYYAEGGWEFDPEDLDPEAWYELEDAYDTKQGIQVEGLGLVRMAETEGGGEGSGEHMHLVLSVTAEGGEPTRYFRKDGFYSSYGGSEWDGDFYEVKPEDRVVTFYERRV